VPQQAACDHTPVINHYVRFADAALQLDLAAVLGAIKDASRRCAVACGHP
jgi:hypothetical protein